MIADNQQWINFRFAVGPFRFNHWLVWIGTLYVAFVVPTIALLKKRSPDKYITLFRVHIFGNLLAFLLVSIHFMGQISRSAQSYPDLGTGVALYADMTLLIATGFIHRFQIIPQIKPQTRKFIHVALTFAFYLIIVIHILHGLRII